MTATKEQHIFRVRAALAGSQASDRELMERYVSARDEQAFADLVARHGDMVLRVCRRVLMREYDAHDAFQATFVVLARKAHSESWRATLAGWLHGVAYRVAHKARVERARRQRREQRAATARPLVTPPAELSELEQVIDEEVERLPEKYRLPLVLCCLQDQTLDEAAQQLGWSITTVKGRLQRGREQLRARLQRRGITLSLACLTLSSSHIRASSLLALETSTLMAVTTGNVPARVAALSQGVLHTMLWKNWFASLLLVGIVILAGLAGVTFAVQDSRPTKQIVAARAAAVPAPAKKSWRSFVDAKELARADEVFVGKVKAAHLFDFPAPGVFAPAAQVDYEVTEIFKGQPNPNTAVMFPIGWKQHMDEERYMAPGRLALHPDRFPVGELHLVYVKGDTISAITYLNQEVAAR
ncbi:MAG: RNA polymerase sigma factor [Gemmataceae bacterium]